MTDAALMIKLRLDISLPDSADVTAVVYLLRATRQLVGLIWPGATLRCHPAFITRPKTS
jgi:hypothetical protein